MNRVLIISLRLAVAAIFLCSGTKGLRAQTPAQTPAQTSAQTPPTPSTDGAPAKAPEDEEEKNPFAPEPAPPLPAGMSGSDVNDPRFNLTPGLYDAGETSMGMKHILLLKKPD